jgi:riboflavin biosynthesis pyrimidine reductase
MPGEPAKERQPDEEHKPDYTALSFPDPPPDRPYVIINMVSSVDGKVTIEGTEKGIGSPTDQRLMRELRVHADVVMNGAGTLRASGTTSRVGDPALEQLRLARGKPLAPIAAVLSASGDLPLDRAFFTARDFEAVIYLSSQAPPGRRTAIEATGRRVFDLPPDHPQGETVTAMLSHMRHELGARLLLVEGGPHLNGQLIEAGLVDEFHLTLGPGNVSGPGPHTAGESDRPASLDTTAHLDLLTAIPNPATNEVYTHYRIRRE